MSQDVSVSTPHNTIYLVILVSILGFLYRVVVYPLFISPLRHIPGPKLAAITKLYLNYHYYRETGVPLVKQLHSRYGPIVRVGPTEIVVDDPKHIPAIYGVRSKFSKPATAALFENYGFPCAFSAITREDHRERRRPIAKVYTMSSHMNNTPLLCFIRNRLECVSRLLDQASGHPTDIYPLATHFALDNVSYMVYGKSLNTLDGQNSEAADHIRCAAIATVPLVRFETLFTKVLAVWPLSFLYPKFIIDAFTARDYLMAMNESLINEVTGANSLSDPERTAVGCLQAHAVKDHSLTGGHVKSECFDHVMAGADTTAAAIIYMMYSLARNPHYQERLRKEVSSLPESMDPKSICALQFLDQLTLEVLRLYAPGPGSLQQRVTPRSETTYMSINGVDYRLPPSTVIGVQAYSLHRSIKNYGHDVEEFKPERWGTTEAEQLRLMKEAWIPFGSGARTCIGMNLATIELKLITASIVRRYAIELPLDADESDMLPIYGVVIRPKQEACKLIFRPLHG